MRPWKLAEVNYGVVKEQSYEVAVLPLGATEPHNLHLPYGTDIFEADLVGEKTFGEGAQQKTFDLPGGAALILSVAKYESPSGKKIQDEGVTPGVLVASAQDTAAAEVPDEDSTEDDTHPAAVTKPTVTVDEN